METEAWSSPYQTEESASAGKRMATVFWDMQGIFSIDWLSEKTTINSDYYIQELEDLREAIKRKRRGRGVLLQHDNARPHVSKQTKEAIHRLGFECVPHPPYSPDLAPSDYWLFGEIKRTLRGKRVNAFKNLEREINQLVKGSPPDFYATGIGKLPERWERCRKLRGIYWVFWPIIYLIVMCILVL